MRSDAKWTKILSHRQVLAKDNLVSECTNVGLISALMLTIVARLLKRVWREGGGREGGREGGTERGRKQIEGKKAHGVSEILSEWVGLGRGGAHARPAPPHPNPTQPKLIARHDQTPAHPTQCHPYSLNHTQPRAPRSQIDESLAAEAATNTCAHHTYSREATLSVTHAPASAATEAPLNPPMPVPAPSDALAPTPTPWHLLTFASVHLSARQRAPAYSDTHDLSAE